MSKTAHLKEIEDYLNKVLSVKTIPDYAAALNGLQLENNGKVTKIASAVDASLPVIQKAVDQGADMLIVHHGMFWHGAQKLVKAQYQKLKIAMDANLAIYSAHIPLDIHAELGNNAVLAQKIGMENPEPFHDWKGIKLGLKQEMQCDFQQLVERVSNAVSCPAHFCAGRNTPDVGVVGIITGGAGSELQAMVDDGIETFITGEGPHWSYPLAEELGVNIIYGGHYATETFGVRMITELLSREFAVEQCFIDHPTGL